jgi:hypothetical protein
LTADHRQCPAEVPDPEDHPSGAECGGPLLSPRAALVLLLAVLAGLGAGVLAQAPR